MRVPLQKMAFRGFRGVHGYCGVDEFDINKPTHDRSHSASFHGDLLSFPFSSRGKEIEGDLKRRLRTQTTPVNRH